ncbi:MFS transporter [Falsigemmobacter intermedius]|nr:MFS transporter [Falsigemmobacter intermedius]
MPSPLPPLSADKEVLPRVGIVILALAMGGFSIGTIEFAAMSLVPYFAADLGVDAATAANAISAYAIGVVCGAPVLAVLGAGRSRRSLLIGFMGLYALANLAAAVAPDWNSLLLFRFLSGLPHGAYFGVAALVAASLVPPNRRTWAVSMVMMGLTVATLVGVPASSLLAQGPGWRWGFGVAALLAMLCVGLVLLYAPKDKPEAGASPAAELSALGNRQVLLTLLTAAVGFGGLFAVYTYIASTLQEVTLAPSWAEPMMFTITGLGMVVGTLVVSRVADRNPLRSVGVMMLLSMAMLLAYPVSTQSLPMMAVTLFGAGFAGAVGPAMQTHLMDVAGRAQTMAAAMHHAAFNAANALGPFLAAIAVSRGFGFPASGYVGAALAFTGFLILCFTAWDYGRSREAVLK